MPTATDRIEDIRVAWERDLEAEIDAEPRMPRKPGVDPGLSEPRVLLDRSMAERVHRVADEAARRLGCPDPFTLYQTPRAEPHVAAQALLRERPFAIRLIGPIARSLDDQALAALIGHELGHWLALGPRASPPSRVLYAWERGAERELARMGVAGTEITAERFALLAACGELEVTVRLDVAGQTLDSPQALGLRELDYLAEVCRKVEGGQAPLMRSGPYDGYPTREFALYATHLFWRSDVHRELTGVGPGDLVLRDVDARLYAMCERAVGRGRRPAPDAAGSRPAVRQPSDAKTPVSDREGATPSSRAWAAIQNEAREVATSVRTAVGKVLGDVTRPSPSEPATNDAELKAALDELEAGDDLEARFRELEKRARDE